jgi:hypothetical protein
MVNTKPLEEDLDRILEESPSHSRYKVDTLWDFLLY